MKMQLPFDPTIGEPFWLSLLKIPGYPQAEHIPLQTMRIASGALFELPQLIRQTSHLESNALLAVIDSTPMQREKADLKPLVLQILRQAGWSVEVIVLSPDESGQVHTTMQHIQNVYTRLHVDTAVVSIGSGVVTDITKHACHLFEQETGRHLPYVVYQTANSVNAFTSNMAPVFVEGVKRTLPSRYADALVCDLETLRDAPLPMTLAGVGDQLAPLVSFADWRLANLLGMDPSFCELPQALMRDIDKVFLEYAQDIRRPTLTGMDILARIITLGGLAVSLVHATTPLSGFEHVISHVLDLVGEARHTPLALHGSQVALAAILSAQAYQFFLDEFNPATIDLAGCFPTFEEMEKRIQQIFTPLEPTGGIAAECWSDYRLKLEKWHNNRHRLAHFLGNWTDFREELRSLVCPPLLLKDILRQVGAPTTFAELSPSFPEADIKFAFFNAPLIRRRLTLGDMFIFTNWDRENLWQRLWSATQQTS